MTRRSIYVVDDEEPIRRSLKLMLAVQGHQVTVFDSGRALLDEVEALAPGCILLDVRMPDMDGIEVQRHLDARGVDLPVVVMTGHGDLAIAVSALQGGAVRFLEKPFSKAHLNEALRAAFLKLEQPDAYRSEVDAAASAVAALPEGERRVLAALATCHSNERIAAELGLATAAVEVSRARIFSALGVESLPAAVQVAFAAGLGERDALRKTT